MDGELNWTAVVAGWGDEAAVAPEYGTCYLEITSDRDGLKHSVSIEPKNAVELAKAILKAYWL